MKGKKKKGSTLITVLALAIVTLAFTGVIITSIMSTMKSNTGQRVREDLRFAAESGIEIAKSYFKSGKTSIDTRAGGVEPELDSVLRSDTVGKVEIFMETVGGKDLVKSIAYEKNGSKKEMVTIQYNKSIEEKDMTNIFDYGLVAGNGGITIESIGDIDMGNTPVSSGNGINISGNVTMGPNESNNIKNVNFKNWGNPVDTVVLEAGKVVNTDGYAIGHFDFATREGKDSYKEIKITKMNTTLNSMHNTAEGKWEIGEFQIVGKPEIDPFDYLKTVKKEPVVVIEVAGLNHGQSLTIIFVNSKNFEINLNQSLNLNNTVIINKGNIMIQNEEGKHGNVISLNNSTIFGEKVSIKEGAAIHMAGQPSNNGKNGVLLEEEEEVLNELLKVILVNFGKDENGGTSSSENIEIIEGTFSN